MSTSALFLQAGEGSADLPEEPSTGKRIAVAGSFYLVFTAAFRGNGKTLVLSLKTPATQHIAQFMA